MAMLEQFYTLLHERRIYLVVCGIEKDLQALMTSTGLRRKIGEENIFYADNRLFQSTQLAMARATAVYHHYEQAQKRMRQESGQVTDPRTDLGPRPVTGGSLMITRFPLFGDQHQAREAVWLLSEAQKFKASINPEPLFLQDRNGALFGELSRWHVLRALIEGSDDSEDEAMDDSQVAEMLRRNFMTTINQIARTDVIHHQQDTPLASLLRASAENDQGVVPICDEGGRLKGFCTSNALLAGLDQSLQAMAAAEATREEGGDV